MKINPIDWAGSWQQGHAVIIDQTRLPEKEEYSAIETPQQMWDAIKALKVRGAPAIGIAAGYGLFLGIREAREKEEFFSLLDKNFQYLESSRPTAVNLVWALKRMQKKAWEEKNSSLELLKEILWKEANKILAEDREVCKKMGEIGNTLVKSTANLLTHCNAGGLATSGYGTALSVFYTAFASGKKIHVYADETRPLWQGARLTAWELHKANIPCTLICDNTAGFLMQQKKIDMIFVGADRITANGDTANKIGTYSLAVLAKAHGIPFYIVAPVSTFDLSLEEGSQIKIEERSPWEVTKPYGIPIAPEGISVYSPAFDVTPASYLSGIITEKGLIEAPLSKERIQDIVL